MIKSDSLTLVPLSERHIEPTFRWLNDPQLMRLLDRAKLVSQREHRDWFESLSTSNDTKHFAIERSDNGLHVGNIWLANIDMRHRKAELRICIGDAQNMSRGMGSEAIRTLCQHAFADLQLHKIYACVLGINPRAKRAFEKAGFRVEGTLRADRLTLDAWTDVFLFGLLSTDVQQDTVTKSIAEVQMSS